MTFLTRLFHGKAIATAQAHLDQYGLDGKVVSVSKYGRTMMVDAEYEMTRANLEARSVLATIGVEVSPV